MKKRRKSEPRLYYADECLPVLVALDKDFWQRRKFNLSGHPGVIVLKTTSSTPSAVSKVAEKTFKRINNVKLKESVLYVSTDKIRRWRNGEQDEISWKK